jgi:CRISPR system Cascade subunit CasB
LLESSDLEVDALFLSLRRVLPLMKRKVDVVALARDLIYWGERVKKEWAYSYDWPPISGN